VVASGRALLAAAQNNAATNKRGGSAAHRERGHRSEASGWIEGLTDLLVYSLLMFKVREVRPPRLDRSKARAHLGQCGCVRHVVLRALHHNTLY
jgi:hypothetical protein